MDVHLRDLRYFVAVAEELHFTRAAQRLFVSQPALSRQIAKLEDDLRVQLLSRDRRRVTLTPAGAALLDRARDLLSEWDAARTAVADAAARAAAILRIGVQTSVGRGLLRRIRGHLGETHPNWRVDVVQISWGDPTCGLGDRTADVTLAWLPMPEPKGYRCVAVSEERRHLLVPDTHRLAHRSEVSMHDVASEPFIALPESAGPLRSFWLAADDRDGPPVVGAEATSADETFELLAAGAGVVLISEGNAELYQRDGTTSIPVVGIGPATLGLVWREDDDREVIRTVAALFT